MTAAEARAAAAKEGLTLVRAENPTGFKGVYRAECATAAQAVPGDTERRRAQADHLGYFATAEEAALAFARFLGPEGVAAGSLRTTRPSPWLDDGGGGARGGGGGGAGAGARRPNATGFKGVCRATTAAARRSRRT